MDKAKQLVGTFLKNMPKTRLFGSVEQWRLTGNLWADLKRSLCRQHLIGLWWGLVHRTMRSGKHNPKTLFHCDVKMLLCLRGEDHVRWLIDLSSKMNFHSRVPKVLALNFNEQTRWQLSWLLTKIEALFIASSPPDLLRRFITPRFSCHVSSELSGQCDTLTLRGLRLYLLHVQGYSWCIDLTWPRLGSGCCLLIRLDQNLFINQFHCWKNVCLHESLFD